MWKLTVDSKKLHDLAKLSYFTGLKKGRVNKCNFDNSRNRSENIVLISAELHYKMLRNAIVKLTYLFKNIDCNNLE